MAGIAVILGGSVEVWANRTHLPQQSIYSLCMFPRYKESPNYGYAPRVYRPSGGGAHAFQGAPLRRNQWSAWEFLDEQCGVELHVRYKMNNQPFRRVESVAQFRYVNTRGGDATSHLYDVHFRLNGGDEIAWAGETVYLGPYSVLEGLRFHMAGDTPLRALRKSWKVTCGVPAPKRSISTKNPVYMK